MVKHCHSFFAILSLVKNCIYFFVVLKKKWTIIEKIGMIE